MHKRKHSAPAEDEGATFCLDSFCLASWALVTLPVARPCTSGHCQIDQRNDRARIRAQALAQDHASGLKRLQVYLLVPWYRRFSRGLGVMEKQGHFAGSNPYLRIPSLVLLPGIIRRVPVCESILASEAHHPVWRFCRCCGIEPLQCDGPISH